MCQRIFQAQARFLNPVFLKLQILKIQSVQVRLIFPVTLENSHLHLRSNHLLRQSDQLPNSK